MNPWRAAGCWLVILTATFGWLLGGATWALATGALPPPWLFTAPLVTWLVIGGFGAVIWGGLSLIRRIR